MVRSGAANRTYLVGCRRGRGTGDAGAVLCEVAVEKNRTNELYISMRELNKETYTSRCLGLKKLTFHASTRLHVAPTRPARSLRSATVDTTKPAPKIGMRGTVDERKNKNKNITN
jgi:hypothetical protein